MSQLNISSQLLATAKETLTEPDKTTSSYSEFAQTITGSDPKAPSEFLLWIGDFHPILLHFPVVLIALAALLELLSWKDKGANRFAPTLKIIYPLMAVTTFITVIAGTMLAIPGEYDTELLDRHGWLGLVLLVMVIIASIMRWKSLKDETTHQSPVALAAKFILFAAVMLSGAVGHDGASMTHGEDQLWKHAPDWVRSLMGIKTREEMAITKAKAKVERDAKASIARKERLQREEEDRKNQSEAEAAALKIAQAKVFHDKIMPIMEQSCTECHGKDKGKGKLRFHTVKDFKKVFDEELIIPKDSDESSFYYNLFPDVEDDIMPPKGKGTPLTDEQKATIKKWIDDGAILPPLKK